MSKKSLLKIISIILITFVIIMIVFIGLFKYSPETIGLNLNKNNEQKLGYKTQYQEPKLSLTKSQFDDLQREVIRNTILKSQIDDLILLNSKLKDSLSYHDINHPGKNTAQVKSIDSLKKLAVDSLSKYIKLFKDTLNAKVLLEKKYSDLAKRLVTSEDSLKNKNLAEFAKIYENSEPAEVAKILQKIDKVSAAKILKLMNKKKAGKVLDILKTENAADMLTGELKDGSKK